MSFTSLRGTAYVRAISAISLRDAFTTVIAETAEERRAAEECFSDYGREGAAMDGETRITEIILEEAIRIHRKYGPGLLESAYERLLAHALERRGLRVRRQVPVPLIDDGLYIEVAFRADLLVEECVVVETKSTRDVDPADASQLLSHIRLLDHRVGLVLNFGQSTMRKGMKRVINRHRITPTLSAPPDLSSSPRTSAPPRSPREQW